MAQNKALERINEIEKELEAHKSFNHGKAFERIEPSCKYWVDIDDDYYSFCNIVKELLTEKHGILLGIQSTFEEIEKFLFQNDGVHINGFNQEDFQILKSKMLQVSKGDP